MHVTADPPTISFRSAAWDRLASHPLPKAGHLLRHLPAGADAPDAAAIGYDLLRTRAVAAMTDSGWRRLGVTQPRSRQAAAATALNLALSIARRPSQSVLLVDLDLKKPRLGALLGMTRAPLLGPALRSGALLAGHAVKVGENLAVLANAGPDQLAAETLQEPTCAVALREMIEVLQPDIALFLLPPLLDGDAGLAGRKLVDTALLVLDGRVTSPADVRRCDQLADDGPEFLGLFLYDAEG